MTPSALKQQIESQLAQRIPGALSPGARFAEPRQAFADGALSELLGGGVPIGAITEVYGNGCSGRTSLAFSLLSAVTAEGNVAAWIDVSDSLDPEGAALCGVELERLLWVRCGKGKGERRGQESKAEATRAHGAAVAEGEGAVVPRETPAAYTAHKPVGGGGSPHPRAESRGMPAAIDALLQRKPYYAAIPERRAHKQIGTPGMPNRDVALAFAMPGTSPDDRAAAVGQHAGAMAGRSAASRLVPPSEIVPVHGSLFGRQIGRKPMPFPHASPYREEQIATDRQPSRRAKQVQAGAGKQPIAVLRGPQHPAGKAGGAAVAGSAVAGSAAASDPWAPLDQALRAVDLLLQGGGFSLLVLDLGSVPQHMAWRIPLATWFRFRTGCSRSRASLLVISQHPCARASADLTVAMELGGIQAVGGTVAVGSQYRLHVEQQRRGGTTTAESNVISIRKPVRAERSVPGVRTWTAARTWGVRA